MSDKNINELARIIQNRAQQFGADLSGTVSIEDLKHSPSHEISGKMPVFNGVGTKDVEGRKRGIVKWPDGARSAIVIAVEHSPEKPEMDWWVTTGASTGNTAGNRLMIHIVSKLAAWLEKEHGIKCFKLPYHVEHGGIYMKDAAVLAGLGSIGKNNLLISPRYGPRLRLRVILTDAALQTSGPIEFAPCENCPMPCHPACPQDAFARQIYSAEKYGQEELPATNGIYDRLRCNQQMIIDESNIREVKNSNQEKPQKLIKYCRECELACPVGSV